MGPGVIVLKNATLASGATLDDTGAAVVDNVTATGASSVAITGGAVNHDVHVAGTSGTVRLSNTTIGDNLVVSNGAGAVSVSNNTVADNITVDNNAPGGATVTANRDHGLPSARQPSLFGRRQLGGRQLQRHQPLSDPAPEHDEAAPTQWARLRIAFW